MPVIQDNAGNPLITQSAPMIGFVPVPAPGEAVNLRMYQFLIEGIRQEDQNNGDKFVERYLEGPQSVWGSTTAAISSIPQLWDVATIPDRLLQFLKRIVGWTPDLDNITDPLDALTLRRLIAASVPFWKRRGPEDAVEDILRLVTGARLRIWNWFDFRIVLDETAFGEDWNGFDPWMISLPGPPDVDEYRSNIRIVDDGTLDREVVRNLVKLTRPVGERVEISYISLLDLFQVDDDNSQWMDEPDPQAAGGGASSSSVALGALTMDAISTLEEAYVDVSGAADWNNYTFTVRIRGLNESIIFYRTSNVDFYEVSLLDGTNSIRLRKFTAGVPTDLATFAMIGLGIVLDSDVLYAIRIEAVPENGTTRVKVYFESAQVINVADPSHVQGTVGVGHASGATDFVMLDEIELFFNPLETDTIDINP